MRAPNRVTLAYGHSNSFGDRLGVVTDLSEDAVGLRMRVKLDRSRAEQALDALSSSHSALSVAFAPIVPRYGTERPGELVTRTSVHLDHIAAVTQGAYDLARLTSVRGDTDLDPDPTPAEVAAAEEEQKRRELAAWVDELTDDPWAALRT
jgi:HK97 family phage prohead protease